MTEKSIYMINKIKQKSGKKITSFRYYSHKFFAGSPRLAYGFSYFVIRIIEGIEADGANFRNIDLTVRKRRLVDADVHYLAF